LIPGATVVITDTDTGAVRTVTSNGAGFFVAPFLQSGHYEVVAGGGSFAKIDRKGIIVVVGDTIAVNAVLPPSSVSTEVVVNGSDEPVLDTAKTSASQTIDQAVISNLPVAGRRFDNFVLLTPNVVPDGSSGILSFRGISGLFNQNLVDGTNNNQAFFSEVRGRASGAPYVYSIDSIKEFSSSVSGYSAEFGTAAGGIVNAITKSGGNQIHGDLFYYLRYPDLNALDPYSKWSALHNNGNPTLLTQTVHQQQQFGGSVGGPIIKDKLFYFFTYDGYRKVNPILYTSTAGASLNLASATNWSLTNCPTGLTTAQCAAAITFINSGLGAFPRNLKQDIFFPKLDYQLNNKNHIAAQFLWDDFHQPNGYNSSATVSNGSVTSNGTANFHERIFIGSWDSVLGGTKANSLRGQWSRDLETDTTNGGGPFYSVSNVFSAGETSALPRPKFPDEHRIEAFDVFTFTKGKHTPKMGVDLNFIHEQLQNLFQGDGSYSYSSGATPAANFANWVQDIYGVNGAKHYTTFTQVHDNINATAPGLDDFWNKNLGGFAEDSWKIARNLTLNAGLRYDVQLVPQPAHPYQYSANGVASPFGTYYTNTIHINYKMYSPRFGFAWSPQVGTVVRGSYGMFYGLNSNSLYYTTRVENGVYQQQFNFGPTSLNAPSAPNVLFTPPGPPLAAAFAGAATPSALYGSCTGAACPALPAGTVLSYRGIDPKFTNPYTHSFDLALEQELPLKSTLTLGYVGTRGMRLPYDVDENQPHATTVRTYQILNAAGVIDTTQGKAGFVTVPFTPINTLRPSPNDGNVLVGFSGVNSWYHSGVATFRKPFDHGLELLVNYTWAKAMDESQVAGGNSVQNSGGGTFQGTNIILDPFNLKGKYGNGINLTREYGRSDLDVRGRMVATFVYTPMVHAKFLPKYATYAANGWEFSGTYTAQSGQPLTSLMSGTLSGAYAGLDGGATGLAVTLNDSAGAGRAPFVYRNNQVFQGIHNLDVRAGRSITIHNDIKMDFFAEAFNVVNHINVAGVSASAYQYQNPVAGTTCTGSAPCIVPYTATKFGTPTSTSGVLFGPRQLQFAAKLHF
jgi:outer membrane receptor protein involved in Fe transport